MQFRFPPTVVLAIFAYASSVLAQSGISGISSDDEESSSNSDGYFSWQSDVLGEFLLALIFGVITLLGGGYWLLMRYRPAVKKAGASHPMYVWTWMVWGVTLLYYILDTSWTASFAHATATRITDSYTVITTSFASMAFSNFAAAGWMTVLLTHAYAVRRKVYVPQKVSARHGSFGGAWIFIFLLALLGGIVRPGVVSTPPDPFATLLEQARITAGLLIAATIVGCLGAFFMFAAIFITRKAAPPIEGAESSDHLRMALFIAAPLWILYHLIHFILADVVMSNFSIWMVFDPSPMFFGFASLATIVVLPTMVVEPPPKETKKKPTKPTAQDTKTESV